MKGWKWNAYSAFALVAGLASAAFIFARFAGALGG